MKAKGLVNFVISSIKLIIFVLKMIETYSLYIYSPCEDIIFRLKLNLWPQTSKFNLVIGMWSCCIFPHVIFGLYTFSKLFYSTINNE